MKYLSLLIVVSFIIGLSQSDDSPHGTFFVKPGGQTMVFEKEWKGFKCTFTYEAQGGTHEEWRVMMEIADGNLLCTFTRGEEHRSYLFFQTFSATVSGPGVKLEQFEAINTGNTFVEGSECKMDRETNTLRAIPEKFKNHLERITLLASLAKQEL